MIPGEDKAEVNLSNEFFKKLNQQIVQKDNLIKLLQLQIKNLKAQGDAEQGPKKADLIKSLETKEAEIKSLEGELQEHKENLSQLIKEKDEQIEALNRAIEESRREKEGQPSGSINEAEFSELQQKALLFESELEEEKRKNAQLAEELATEKDKAAFEIGQLKSNLDAVAPSLQEAESLKANIASLEAQLSQAPDSSASSEKDAEIEKLKNDFAAKEAEVAQYLVEIPRLNEELTALKQVLEAKEQESAQKTVLDAELSELKVKYDATVVETEQLKAVLAEKESQLEQAIAQVAAQQSAQPASDSQNEAIEQIKQESEQLKQEIEMLRQQSEALKTELDGVKPELDSAKSELETTKIQLDSFNAEKQVLTDQIEELKNKAARADELEGRLAEITSQSEAAKIQLESSEGQLELKNMECKQLIEELESLKTQAASKAEFENQKEMEQLTEQVADQLLAIQKFEQVLQQSQDDLVAKDSEIASLKDQIIEMTSSEKSVEFSPENEVFTYFIDFFDELDTHLKRNPNPDLQSLHKKLLERLIIPNEIQYMPVIAEKFDATKHIPTDYFRSDKFEDRTIVFEVEKGYKRGDVVIKKSKVWIVQNHFDCGNCGAKITLSDSRFCFKCGEKIVAPNGFPADSLPEFEPNPATYLRFAERMIETGNLDLAKEYLEEGLRIDSTYLPLLSKLSDVYSLSTDFEKAMEVLKQAILVKDDPKLSEKIRALEVRNNIFQQARALNLPPGEFEKLVTLIQQ
ncbi:MAG: nucleotide exchange factor GrpE [Candidatus Riflebacteria bacterium]|nr:nucleotide exchange factor GrpE [Candidatus Riflebacteria bacterium]